MVPGAGIGAYNRGAPSTSWKARTLVRAFTPDSAPDSAFGIYLQENATSKSLGMQFNLTSTTPRIYIVNRPNGSTSQVGEVLPVNVSPSSLGFHDYVWLEAEYDAGNVGSEVVFRYSTDGVNFITFRTYNVTTYFTTAPDLTAFNFDAGGANTETVYTQFLYYETTL